MNDYQQHAERRSVNKLCSYWNNIRGERPFPSYEEVEPGEIVDCWPYCFVLRLKEEGDEPQYTCTYVGDKVAEIYSSEILKNLSDSTVFSPLMLDLLSVYIDEMSITREPVIDESESVDEKGNYLKVRQCLLPLGSEGKINAIIGAVGCKLY